MERIENYSPEKALEVYKAMFDTLPQSMFLLDKDKNIIGIFNAAPETLAGFSVDDIVGNSILKYAEDPSSPFYEACTMLNDSFDQVFNSGVPLKFQYKILDTYLEAIITKIEGERILSQVHDITDIILRQQEIEYRKRSELTMALIAGGLTSWSYNVRKNIFTSSNKNNVIGDEMSMNDLLFIIVPEHRKMTEDMLSDIIEGKSKHGHITVKVRNQEGVMQWSDVHAIPEEYGPDGRATLITGSQKDATGEYEYNEELKKLNRQNQLILNNTDSGFVYLTPDLNIEWENVSKVFTNPEIVCLFDGGRLCSGSCDRQESCCKSIILEALETKEKVTNKFRTVEGMVVESTAQLVFDDNGETEGIVMRIDDITQEEQSLHEIAEAKEKAEQSDKLKSAFLANMSHEIRTPLNSIVGFSQLIPDAETPEEQQEYIGIVNSNSEMLLNLINDILDLSKIEAGYFTYSNAVFNLPTLFTELETIFRHRIHEGVEFVCELPCEKYPVNLDKIRITQIVSNFMTNAIKFTKQGCIKMGFEIVREGVKLYVKDTGCGMSEDQVHRVFDRFEKFNLFEQGTGLGTSIAKAIVDVYKGSIGVESEPGKGSTFWAILSPNMETEKNGTDLPSLEETNISDRSAEEHNRSSVRILIAEDNDSNYMLIRAILKGYDLTRAYNGQEAVDIAKLEDFNLILMDIRMPVMDGVEATKHIRDFNTRIPIIAVTANAFDEDKKRAHEAGVTDFLTKPLNKSRLIETISQYY